MSSATSSPPTSAANRFAEPSGQSSRARTLRLRQTAAAWVLLSPDGGLVFRAEDPGGRRACLEFACRHDIPAVFS